MAIVKNSNLSNIGKVIKEIRQEKNLSLQDLGNRSDVTPGLLSKIENFRTIPSIPVLFNIARALEVEMRDLVRDVKAKGSPETLICRAKDLQGETREDSEGLTYFNMLSAQSDNQNIRVSLVEVEAGTYRPPVATDCMELLYVLSGMVRYGIGEDEHDLYKGDAMFFDGSQAHSVENAASEKATLFKVYFMNPPE